MSTFALISILLCTALASALAIELPTSQATIAFHVTVSASEIDQLNRFFHRLYHPSNIYLIDFAHPLDPEQHLHDFPKANVYVRRAENYVPKGVSEVINVLDGMSFFLDREDVEDAPPFDYFIHTTPEEYPVVRPEHLRRMLHFPHDKLPPNFIRFSHSSQWRLFDKELNQVHFDHSLSLTHNLSVTQELEASKLSHPDWKKRVWSMPRTEKFFAVNHAFVKMAVDSMLSKKLLMTLTESSHVYEHYFGALALNAGEAVGQVVKSSSLRCIDSMGIDKSVTGGFLPMYRVDAPSIAFMRRTPLPCVFTWPFRADVPHSLDVRDDIDTEFLDPAEAEVGTGPGFQSVVYKNILNVVGSS